MKTRIYLDTSVVSVRFDSRAGERQALTKEFFDQVEISQLCTSEVTIQEVEATSDDQHRQLMVDMINQIEILPLSDEVKTVGQQYMVAGIFSARMMLDAYHVAAASVAGIPILVSWNFRHLVNRRRRAAVLDVNMQLGLIALEIISPPEI